MASSQDPNRLVVGVGEAKTHLSRLLQQVEAGGEVEIRRGGVPVARLVGLPAVAPKPLFGSMRGEIVLRDGWDELGPEWDDYR